MCGFKVVVRLCTRLYIGFNVWVWCFDLMVAFLLHTGLTVGVCGVLILRRMIGVHSWRCEGIIMFLMWGG